MENTNTTRIVELSAAYMRRTLAQLRDLAHTMELATDGSKAQLIGRIVARHA